MVTNGRSRLRLSASILAFAFAARAIAGEAEDAFDAGYELLNAGKTALAIPLFDKAIALKPDFAKAYRYRGSARESKGDLDGAAADFAKAVELDPRDAEAWIGRARIREQKGDWDGAISDAGKALELSPGNAVALSGRARARFAKGDWDGAISDRTAAIEANPRDATAHVGRGRARLAKGLWDAAAADFGQAMGLEPAEGGWALARSAARLAAGRPAEAAEDARKALDLLPKGDPRAPRAALFAHFALLRTGKADAARKVLEDFAADHELKAWPGPAISHLVWPKRIEETDVLKAAADAVSKTEAHAFLGLRWASAGSVAAARVHFAQVRETGVKSTLAYAAAMGELGRLPAERKP